MMEVPKTITSVSIYEAACLSFKQQVQHIGDIQMIWLQERNNTDKIAGII